MFLFDFNRRLSPDLRLSNDFPWFCIVLCFQLILIVGPRPIFGYLMIFYGCALFSFGFDMFWGNFYRRPSPDFQLSDDFLWFGIVFLWFWYVSV